MSKAEIWLLIKFSILLYPVKFCWSKWKSFLLLMVWSWSLKERIGSAELMASLSSSPLVSWIRHSQPENCSSQLLNPDNSFPLDVQFFQDAIGIDGIHFSSIFISFLPPEALSCPLACNGSPAPCLPVLRLISCAIWIKRWLIAPCPTSNCATGSPTLCCGGGGGIGAWTGVSLWPGFSQGILPEEIPNTGSFEDTP